MGDNRNLYGFLILVTVALAAAKYYGFIDTWWIVAAPGLLWGGIVGLFFLLLFIEQKRNRF